MKLRTAWYFLSHGLIVLAGMFLVFFCIDRVNPGMDFLGSEISKWLLLAFALWALGCGVLTVVQIRAQLRRELGQSGAAAQEGAGL